MCTLTPRVDLLISRKSNFSPVFIRKIILLYPQFIIFKLNSKMGGVSRIIKKKKCLEEYHDAAKEQTEVQMLKTRKSRHRRSRARDN